MGAQRPSAMPGSPATFLHGPRGHTESLGLSAGRAVQWGSSRRPRSRALAFLGPSSFPQPSLYTPEIEAQTWGQLFHLERHRSGRGPFILSFIQPAFTVPGASVVKHAGP